MKKMPKKQFNEIVALSRAYWESGEEEILRERILLSQAVEKITGVDWLHILDFVDSLVASRGLLPDAENDEIYSALRVIGWEVVEDV
jgi:hypothetical protein